MQEQLTTLVKGLGDKDARLAALYTMLLETLTANRKTKSRGRRYPLNLKHLCANLVTYTNLRTAMTVVNTFVANVSVATVCRWSKLFGSCKVF